MFHLGVDLENSNKYPEINNEEEKALYSILEETLLENSTFWNDNIKLLKGVSEETTVITIISIVLLNLS